MPLSHGLTGLGAIKAGADSGLLRGFWHSALGLWLVAFSGSAPVCAAGCLHGWRAGPRVRSQRRRRFGFRTFRSFFESEFEAPKTALSHGFRGLGAIKARADSGPLRGFGYSAFNGARPLVCCASNPMARPEIRLKRQRHFGARIAACRGGLQALGSRAAKPKAGRAGKWQRTNGCGGALDFASVALFSGANPSSPKRPHRTVSGDLLLSNQERIQACCAALGIRHSALGFGLWLSAAARGFALRVAFTAGG